MNSIPTEGSGKGDTPRRVNHSRYGSNFDEIDWGSTKLPMGRKAHDPDGLWKRFAGKKRSRNQFDWPSVLGEVPKKFQEDNQ